MCGESYRVIAGKGFTINIGVRGGAPFLYHGSDDVFSNYPPNNLSPKVAKGSEIIWTYHIEEARNGWIT